MGGSGEITQRVLSYPGPSFPPHGYFGADPPFRPPWGRQESQGAGRDHRARKVLRLSSWSLPPSQQCVGWKCWAIRPCLGQAQEYQAGITMLQTSWELIQEPPQRRKHPPGPSLSTPRGWRVRQQAKTDNHMLQSGRRPAQLSTRRRVGDRRAPLSSVDAGCATVRSEKPQRLPCHRGTKSTSGKAC